MLHLVFDMSPKHPCAKGWRGGGAANGANERKQDLEDMGLSGEKSGHERCVLEVDIGYGSFLSAFCF